MVGESSRPIRVLQVVVGMSRGGVETWLMHLLRHVNREFVEIDFFVHTDQPSAYDEEILARGAHIHHCPHSSSPVQYARHLLRILREAGPYDVVHSHVHFFSGYVLQLARWAGVPIRIAHSHNDFRALYVGESFARRGYRLFMQKLLCSGATHGLAVSSDAAMDLYGEGWSSKRWVSVQCLGIDFSPFSAPVSPNEVRSGLGIPDGAKVVGHIGRFCEQKNHPFIIQIFHHLAQRDPSVCLLLVGVGDLQSTIREECRRLGLQDRVIFAGSRNDVPLLMRGAMDLFLFPSLHEGLGLVLLEAQAAGLPCVVSDVLPREGIRIPELVTELSLRLPAERWADTVAERLASREERDGFRQKALADLRGSPFAIEVATAELMGTYGAERWR